MTKRGTVTVATSDGLVTIEITSPLGAMRIALTAEEARQVVTRLNAAADKLEAQEPK